LPKEFPPYSTVYWHYKQWRNAGVFEELMRVLHEQVREQVKGTSKNRKISCT
jgi:transposase